MPSCERVSRWRSWRTCLGESSTGSCPRERAFRTGWSSPLTSGARARGPRRARPARLPYSTARTSASKSSFSAWEPHPERPALEVGGVGAGFDPIPRRSSSSGQPDGVPRPFDVAALCEQRKVREEAHAVLLGGETLRDVLDPGNTLPHLRDRVDERTGVALRLPRGAEARVAVDPEFPDRVVQPHERRRGRLFVPQFADEPPRVVRGVAYDNRSKISPILPTSAAPGSQRAISRRTSRCSSATASSPASVMTQPSATSRAKPAPRSGCRCSAPSRERVAYGTASRSAAR